MAKYPGAAVGVMVVCEYLVVYVIFFLAFFFSFVCVKKLSNTFITFLFLFVFIKLNHILV